MKNTSHDILIQEFGCYFHADLISLDSVSQSEITSAINSMLLKLDKEKLDSLLLELLEKRTHSLNFKIEEECDYEWTIEDYEWELYKSLLARMRIKLKVASKAGHFSQIL